MKKSAVGRSSRQSRAESSTDQVVAAAYLNSEERAVMAHLLNAMNGIQEWKPIANSGELVMGIHLLQGFVIAHMLQRIAPECWAGWFEME